MGQKRNASELVEIGNRLKVARLALGLSQKEVCEAIGVKVPAWSHWENGRRIPDPMAMKNLYLLHGVTMEWIYAGDPKRLPFEVYRRIKEEEGE